MSRLTTCSAFWRAAGPCRWFKKDAGFDAEITARFLRTYERAAAGGLSALGGRPPRARWRCCSCSTSFRATCSAATPRTYAADPLARDVARRALARGFDDDACRPPTRQFFYLPFMHSEHLADQERCVELCAQPGRRRVLRIRRAYTRDIVRRFGRFPHRNALLGRATTPDEQEFLDGGGFAG